MKLALDTNAYSGIFRGDGSLVPFLRNDIVLSTIVLGELRAGFALGTKQNENERLLQRFLNQPNVTVISVTNASTHEYGKIFANLRKIGAPIGTNDMWIAAICLEHNLPLLTLDTDFLNIQGLECLPVS